MVSRRQFNIGLIALAFSGLSRHLSANSANLSTLLASSKGYGPLLDDPNGLLDLPQGFSYHVVSALDDIMDDGLPVPDRADGMGCIQLDDDRVALVRNHELKVPKKAQNQTYTEITRPLAYDTDRNGAPLPGGTSNIIYNVKNKQVEQQYMSLLGTVRNCAGGITPWNTWLTCEESVAQPSQGDNVNKEHGYVFEVPATGGALVEAKPIKAMGRFNHEAACIDPRTGIVYLTEDRGDSLFYRYIPKQPGNLHAGGKLQALCIEGAEKFDTRNWEAPAMSMHSQLACRWIDLEDVESPNDDLRKQGFQKGAALFARGEGIHWAENEMFFCCTNGGKAKLGQVMRYVPSSYEGTDKESTAPGQLSLFVESPDIETFNYGDNITVSPNGHLIVCEDQYTDEVNNQLKGITPEGNVYSFARLRWQTEPAGACFSADGKTLFVNVYSPTRTLAITGPWEHFII